MMKSMSLDRGDKSATNVKERATVIEKIVFQPSGWVPIIRVCQLLSTELVYRMAVHRILKRPSQTTVGLVFGAMVSSTTSTTTCHVRPPSDICSEYGFSDNLMPVHHASSPSTEEWWNNLLPRPIKPPSTRSLNETHRSCSP